jgi:hypothetical protein
MAEPWHSKKQCGAALDRPNTSTALPRNIYKFFLWNFTSLIDLVHLFKLQMLLTEIINCTCVILHRDIKWFSIIIWVLCCRQKWWRTIVNFNRNKSLEMMWNSSIFVRFEVLTAVSTKMAVFWVVAPCSLVEVYLRFRGPCCLHHYGYYRPDDGGSKDLWNIGKLLPDYTALQPRRQSSLCL